MRIGLFTDTYHPSINGITYVVQTLKENLEASGHTVYVFCPARSMTPNRNVSADEDNIIRFPSFRSGLFTDFDFTVFFSPAQLRRIKDLELDVIHVFTPSQIGLLGINAALKQKTALVIQHCTDLYEFVENYPIVLPGVLALIGLVFPMSVKLDGRDVREIVKLHRPRLGVTKWNQDIISRGITMLYSKADATIVLSRKSQKQLQEWQDDKYNYELVLMPNGVNAIRRPSQQQAEDFRNKWNITKDDEVFGFVGRLGQEKNLPILIKAMDEIGAVRPKAKLLFVGDFDYRKELEKIASESKYPDRIIFTGSMPREDLGIVYDAMDVFCFPSLKDTQGWVLHEAAHARKPIVLIDKEVSEVVKDGENGYFADDDAVDMAEKIISLLEDPAKIEQFGEISKQLATKYSERHQVHKLEKLYQKIIDQKAGDALLVPDRDA